jgi:hypothetical protein
LEQTAAAARKATDDECRWFGHQVAAGGRSEDEVKVVGNQTLAKDFDDQPGADVDHGLDGGLKLPGLWKTSSQR